jgi:hypothetical protein
VEVESHTDEWTAIFGFQAGDLTAWPISPLKWLGAINYLTIEDIEKNDFSDLPEMRHIASRNLAPDAIADIRKTYTRYNEHNSTIYHTDSISQETLTFSDWEEGELLEVREYSNLFDESFDIQSTVGAESTVTTFSISNDGTNQQLDISGAPFLITDPAYLDWKTETWGVDEVSLEYETVATKVGDDNEYNIENRLEDTVNIRLSDRFSLYHDYLKSDPKTENIIGYTLFRVKGVFVTPADGMVYYTSDKNAFTSENNGKIKGHYLYYDSDENGFYETVFVLTPDDDSDGIYNAVSIVYNYDGKHEIQPYQVLDEDDSVGFSYVENEYKGQYAYVDSQKGYATYMFHGSSTEMKNFMRDHFPNSQPDNYIPRDHIFDISRLMPKEDVNRYAPGLFLDVYSHMYGETLFKDLKRLENYSKT